MEKQTAHKGGGGVGCEPEGGHLSCVCKVISLNPKTKQ